MNPPDQLQLVGGLPLAQPTDTLTAVPATPEDGLTATEQPLGAVVAPPPPPVPVVVQLNTPPVIDHVLQVLSVMFVVLCALTGAPAKSAPIPAMAATIAAFRGGVRICISKRPGGGASICELDLRCFACN